MMKRYTTNNLTPEQHAQVAAMASHRAVHAHYELKRQSTTEELAAMMFDEFIDELNAGWFTFEGDGPGLHLCNRRRPAHLPCPACAFAELSGWYPNQPVAA